MKEQKPEVFMRSIVSKFSSIDNMDQQVQFVKEEEQNIEELEIVNKSTEDPTDLIISQLPEQSIKSSEEQSTNHEIAKEEQVIEVSHIDLSSGM